MTYRGTSNVLEAQEVGHNSRFRDGADYKLSFRKFVRLILEPFLVCAIEHTIEAIEGTDDVEDHITEAIPIAGQLKIHGGGDLDAKYTRLSTSELSDDLGKEGLRIKLNG